MFHIITLVVYILITDNFEEFGFNPYPANVENMVSC